METYQSEACSKIRDYMVTKKIKTLEIDYSGEGDSGDVKAFEPETQSEFPVYHTELNEAAWDWVNDLHEWFETDDGSEGVITLQLSKNGQLTMTDKFSYFINRKVDKRPVKYVLEQ